MNMCCGNGKKAKTLEIIIEDHENERFYLNVDLQDKIREVKQKIDVKTIDPEKSQLYFQRKKLENSWTVEECGLKNQCKLYLLYGQNIKA